MAEQQKREFIQSLKRLKVFFNALLEYKPDKETLAARNFIDDDLEQHEYQIFDLPEDYVDKKKMFQTMKLNQNKDKKVFQVVMDPKN